MSDQTLVIIIVIGVIVAVVAALALLRSQRRRRLQDWYGPEYEHTVEATGSERAADAELLARQKRHETLDIKPLDPGARERYADRWAMVQERFVDDPHAAVAEASELVTTVMSDRGYPTDTDDDQQVADLSVEHGKTVGEYREAIAISARAADGEASTEDLRMAMVHYRALFAELLDATADDLSAVSSGYPYHGADAAETDAAPTDADVDRVDEDRVDVDRAYEDRADDVAAEEASDEAARSDEQPVRTADDWVEAGRSGDYGAADDQSADERVISGDTTEDEQSERLTSDDDAFGRPRR